MGEDGISAGDDYDPKADSRERRRIRYEYRELIAETQNNRLDLTRPDSTGLHKALDKAQKLFNEVKSTREAALDSRFLVVASNLGSQQAQQLQTHLVTFSHDTFVQKLITFMGGRNIAEVSEEDEENEVSTRRRHPPPQLDWNKLGKKACSTFRRTPSIDFMFGPLSMEPPPQRSRQVREKPKDKPDISQKVTPSQLEKVEAEGEATTREVERLHRILYEKTVSEEEVYPVCLFEFVINPHSFSKTVENLFHLSFLVRDGRAEISLDEENGLPLVSYIEMSTEEEKTEKKQVVVNLNLAQYKEIIKTFKITKPMIPPANANRVNGASLQNHTNQEDGVDDDNE
ncbi:non-structural maintenance of chromosomes element 4 homolog A-like [Acropora palmata]|uniref:non-structural maintenance of chromosomes element 4 homolog A-like n=1 Tax=Acropora palmata TaxID=6131 RepID=UPI003DA10E26